MRKDRQDSASIVLFKGIGFLYPFNSYIDSVLGLVDVKKIQNARLRIALDPMYGVSHSSLRTILLTCRCDVDVIHEQHDTLFGCRMPAPSADALRMLSGYVVGSHFQAQAYIRICAYRLYSANGNGHRM